MLKLKLQYFGHLMQRANSLEKTLMLEKIEGRRSRGQQRMRWLDGIINSMDMNLSKLQETVLQVCCRPWGSKVSDTTVWLNNNKMAGILSFLSPSGLTSSPLLVAAIADDYNILCLLIGQEIFHFSYSIPVLMTVSTAYLGILLASLSVGGLVPKSHLKDCSLWSRLEPTVLGTRFAYSRFMEEFA